MVVIGGGDTGTDCVATALRQGCASVIQLEILPEPPKERQPGNPWPEGPVRLKTDYGQVEAIHLTGKDPRRFGVTVASVAAGEGGSVSGVHTVEVSWEGGSMAAVPGTEGFLPAGLVLLAMGFSGPEEGVPAELGLARDSRGNVLAAFGEFRTNVEKVFVAGDMRRGQSLVVWAMEEGRRAAAAVDRFLRGRSVLDQG